MYTVLCAVCVLYAELYAVCLSVLLLVHCIALYLILCNSSVFI